MGARENTSQRTSLVPKTSLSEKDLYNVLSAHYASEIGGKELSAFTKAKLISIAKWLLSNDEKCNLLLLGGVGNGKTSMAQTIYRSLKFLRDTALTNITKDNRAEMRPLLSVPIPMVVKAINVVNKASDNPFVIDDLKREKFLAIDDIGVEPTEIMNFGSRYQPIVDIIYGRYDKKLPTIYTTNLDWSDIKNKYGPRVMDRLIEQCVVIAYSIPSYRTGTDYVNSK